MKLRLRTKHASAALYTETNKMHIKIPNNIIHEKGSADSQTYTTSNMYTKKKKNAIHQKERSAIKRKKGSNICK